MRLEILKTLGYDVGLNLMQVASRSEKEINQFLKDISEIPLSMLYFADSTGSLYLDDTVKLIKQVKSDTRDQ